MFFTCTDIIEFIFRYIILWLHKNDICYQISYEDFEPNLNMEHITKENLSRKSVKQLKEMCSDRSIKGSSKFLKNECIDAIYNYEQRKEAQYSAWKKARTLSFESSKISSIKQAEDILNQLYQEKMLIGWRDKERLSYFILSYKVEECEYIDFMRLCQKMTWMNAYPLNYNDGQWENFDGGGI